MSDPSLGIEKAEREVPHPVQHRQPAVLERAVRGHAEDPLGGAELLVPRAQCGAVARQRDAVEVPPTSAVGHGVKSVGPGPLGLEDRLGLASEHRRGGPDRSVRHRRRPPGARCRPTAYGGCSHVSHARWRPSGDGRGLERKWPSVTSMRTCSATVERHGHQVARHGVAGGAFAHAPDLVSARAEHQIGVAVALGFAGFGGEGFGFASVHHIEPLVVPVGEHQCRADREPGPSAVFVHPGAHVPTRPV